MNMNIHGTRAKIVGYDLRNHGVWEVSTIESITSWGSMHTSKLHVHNGELELCYLVLGRRAHVNEKRMCMMHGGTVWSNVPDVPHSSVGRPSGSSKFYCMRLLPPVEGKIWCGLEYEDAKKAWALLCEMSPDRAYRDNKGLLANFEFISKVLKQKEMSNRETLVRMAVNALVTSFLACKVAEREAYVPTEKIQRLIDYINASDPHEPIAVQDLVKREGLSASYFVNSFQQAVGETPGQYIFGRRIEAAAKRVAAGERISKVAEEFGWDSTQHFSRSFSKYFTETPRGFYKKAQEEKNVNKDAALNVVEK